MMAESEDSGTPLPGFKFQLCHSRSGPALLYISSLTLSSRDGFSIYLMGLSRLNETVCVNL